MEGSIESDDLLIVEGLPDMEGLKYWRKDRNSECILMDVFKNDTSVNVLVPVKQI